MSIRTLHWLFLLAGCGFCGVASAQEEPDSYVVIDEYFVAGNNGGGFRQSVGGVHIDPQGAVRNSTVDELGELSKLRRDSLAKIPAGLEEKNPLRKVSLKRLAATIKKCLDAGKQLPDDVLFLGGLQRVKYVFVYPEEQDIVLAGPAEAWKVNEKGDFVGVTTGQPVLLLEDLLIAFRIATGEDANVTCSIDPKAEGIAKLMGFLKHEQRLAENPALAAKKMEELVGPQVVSFHGVPVTSHFASVMVAADFRMKRLGMGLEPSPIAGMQSFMDLSNGSSNSLFPRWWLASNYEALVKSPAGDAWELRGQGVKAMTEEAHFDANGTRQAGSKAHPLAQKWADSMTTRYEELSAKLPIFTELRNVMDLAVIATLIVHEGLAEKAQFDVASLASPTIPTSEVNVPREIASQASLLRKGKKTMVSVSGGIDVRHGDVIKNQVQSELLSPLRTKAAPDATAWMWWWN